MAFSGRQEDEFLGSIMVSDVLDEAVSWVGSNLSVDDVFDNEAIKEYCKGEFEIDELYDEEDIKSHCELNLCVEDVFTVEELTAWAKSNGFVRV